MRRENNRNKKKDKVTIGSVVSGLKRLSEQERWPTPVSPALQEAEARRSQVQAQPEQST